MTMQESIDDLSAAIDKNVELLAKQREEIEVLRRELECARAAFNILSASNYVSEGDRYFFMKKAGEFYKILNKGTL